MIFELFLSRQNKFYLIIQDIASTVNSLTTHDEKVRQYEN